MLITLQETAGIIIIIIILFFYKNENLIVQEKSSSELKTHAGVLLPQTKWKEGEINEYDVAFYLVIAVIHRLLPGAAEALTTEHYSFSPWHLLWDLHQSSPLRGYESKCVGTNNTKKTAAHFFSAFSGNLQGQYVWFTPELTVLNTAYSVNEDVDIVLKTDKLPSVPP